MYYCVCITRYSLFQARRYYNTEMAAKRAATMILESNPSVLIAVVMCGNDTLAHRRRHASKWNNVNTSVLALTHTAHNWKYTGED